MIRYKSELEDISRRFCPEISECEWLIWSRLSKRQHIFTPRAVKLAVKVYGLQHQEQFHSENDFHRDE